MPRRAPRTLRVRAAPGQIFPMEGRPKRHITDADTVVVRTSPYYRNALRAGDLVEVSDSPVPSPRSTAPNRSQEE